MKKFLVAFSLGAVVVFSFASCSATKKDCQGVRHTKQKGGFYL